MKSLICHIVTYTGIILGIYVGGWQMFIKPILDAAKSFDAGTLTATMVAWTVIKCIFASGIGWGIAIIFATIASIIYDSKRW